MSIHPPPKTNNPTDIRFDRQLRAWAREAGNAELLDRLDVLALADDPFENDYPGADVERERNRERHRELLAEYQRRKRIADARPGVAVPDAERHQAWRDVAREIRERIDLPWLFDHLGYQLHPVGKNGRRSDSEWAGACPVCGGIDRLRVWSGANGRAWCRQCGWSADAIVAAQSLRRDLAGFYPAVTYLAELLNIPLPPAELVAFPSGVTFLPVRKGGRRVG